MKRNGFTLIEMMIAITIFSVVLLFLYQSYASLNMANAKYAQKKQNIKTFFEYERTLVRDLSESLEGVRIIHDDAKYDVVLFQSRASEHDRVVPYIAYVVKEGVLYRLESFAPLQEYPFGADVTADVDIFGEVEHFHVYKALKKEQNIAMRYFLFDVLFKNGERFIYKLHAPN